MPGPYPNFAKVTRSRIAVSPVTIGAVYENVYRPFSSSRTAVTVPPPSALAATTAPATGYPSSVYRYTRTRILLPDRNAVLSGSPRENSVVGFGGFVLFGSTVIVYVAGLGGGAYPPAFALPPIPGAPR